MNSLDSAERYVRRGWAVVPIPRGKKGPIIDEWEKLRLGIADLPRFFRADCNLGVILGEPSGNLVDVDLDHALAIQLADEFLPPTGSTFGRNSKPRSHRLYVVTEPAATKRHTAKVDRKNVTLVEFRCHTAELTPGCQTVFPPSIHPLGERIEWASEGAPLRIEADVLLGAVAELADEIRQRLGVKTIATASRFIAVGPERTSTTGDVERCRRYVARIAGAVSGQGGHPRTFHVACELFRFGLSDSEAAALLAEFNQRCEPKWSDRELAHKLADAKAKVIAAGEFSIRLRRKVEAWRLQKPGEPFAIWQARVHAIEHRIKQRRRQPA